MRHILTYYYWGTLFTVAFYLLFRFHRVDRAAKIICLLIWLGFLTEGIGYYAAWKYHNNYPVYTPSIFIEFVLISLYFNFSVPVLQKKNVGIYIAAAGVLLGVMNTLFLQPIDTLSSNFIFLECLVVVCFSLFAIYRLLRIDSDKLELQRKVHFWLPFILLFYQCATLSAWGVYDKFGDDAEDAKMLDFSILIINIITYSSFGLIFFRYPKMKAIHVQY